MVALAGIWDHDLTTSHQDDPDDVKDCSIDQERLGEGLTYFDPAR